MRLVIDIDERLYEIITNSEKFLPTMYHASRCAEAVRNGTPLHNKNSKEPKQTDSVVKGLLKLKNDFGNKAYVIVDDKQYSVGDILSELENQTEVGQKFRDGINDMILAYLMKFRGEEE